MPRCATAFPNESCETEQASPPSTGAAIQLRLQLELRDAYKPVTVEERELSAEFENAKAAISAANVSTRNLYADYQEIHRGRGIIDGTNRGGGGDSGFVRSESVAEVVAVAEHGTKVQWLSEKNDVAMSVQSCHNDVTFIRMDFPSF